MITSLVIENFKCFDNQTIPFGDLTLLTGFNSAGKSSAIQPVLLIAQGVRTGAFPTKKYPLNGRFVRLGSVGDVLPANTSLSSIVFRISTESETRSWQLKATAGSRSLEFETTEVEAIEEDESPGSVLRCVRRLSFIGSTRLGLQDCYPIPDQDSRSFRDVGSDGRFAPFEYDRFVDDPVSEGRAPPGSSASTVRKVVDEWMSWLFPGAQANVQFHNQLSALSLEFRVSEFGEWRRPANVGYGFSYAFPIIVALVTAKSGQLIAIDSPEAHLHPRAQSRMGFLLARLASADVQVVVESHSDHVLNGVRLAVRAGLLKASRASIVFFGGDAEFDQKRKKVLPLAIDSRGGISNWPEGFFDQLETDLAQL